MVPDDATEFTARTTAGTWWPLRDRLAADVRSLDESLVAAMAAVPAQSGMAERLEDGRRTLRALYLDVMGEEVDTSRHGKTAEVVSATTFVDV